MPKRKFRRHKTSWFDVIKRSQVPIKRNKQIKKEPLEECRHSFQLGEDRITYIYSYRNLKKSRSIIRIICVSYEIYLNNSWKTIIYYDDAHGEFHRHVMISMDDEKGDISSSGVRQKGDKRKLLEWAIKDLTRNFYYYKREFLKRNKDILT